MIIVNGNVVTRIKKREYPDTFIQDEDENFLIDSNDCLLNSKPPHNVVAIFRGSKLIWLSVYDVDVSCCYSSGTWLDSYPWIDNHTWKDR